MFLLALILSSTLLISALAATITSPPSPDLNLITIIFPRPTLSLVLPPSPTGLVYVKSGLNQSWCLVAHGGVELATGLYLDECGTVAPFKWTWEPSPGRATFQLYESDPVICFTTGIGQVFLSECDTNVAPLDTQQWSYNAFAHTIISSGRYTSGYCLELYQGALTQYNWVFTTPCSGSPNQQWFFAQAPL